MRKGILVSAKRRNKAKGFTLIDAMVAFVVLGMVLAGTYSLVSRSLLAEGRGGTRYDSTAMARAIIEEYVVTYPRMIQSGTYGERWKWQVTERDVSSLRPSDMDRYFRFIEITATITDIKTGGRDESLSTVLARRAQ